MSFPNVPDVTANITISLEEVTNLLLSSIAFEELGLAHIINAEAEKIQYILGTLPGQTPPAQATLDDLIKVDKAVEHVLRDTIKKEMLLQFKLEDTVDIINRPTPSISIQKLVSVDNGVTFQDANVAPGPTLVSPTNPVFKYVVKNTGNVTLSLVSVTDNVLGVISLGGTLLPSATFEITRTGAFQLGEQSNTATATGVNQGVTVESTDSAFYTGVII